jgi:nucleoside-diphosphate-sugar epimerase
MKQDTRQIKTLLLGGGYTLSALTNLLERDSFVITTTSPEKLAQWQQTGTASELVSLQERESIRALFTKYPSIETVIDSIPPLPSKEPTAGITNLLTELPRSVSRIFYLSTTGVYGKQDGSIVSEDTERTPYYQSALTRVQSEDLYFNFPHATTTSFRLSGIYGPGRGVGLSMKHGSYRLVENDPRYTNRIHVEDIIHMLNKALSSNSPLPPALNLSDDDPAPATEVFEFYHRTFQTPPAQYITTEQAEAIGGRLTLNQRVSNALVKERLQYTFLFPSFREGAGTEFS